MTLLLLFLFIFATETYAIEQLPNNLINFNSEQGLNLFKKNLNPNALKLLEHFTTQKTVTYCGVASVVMVLNSSSITPTIDSQHPPYHYFNQDDFFTEQVKQIVVPGKVLAQGIKLEQLNRIIQTYGLKTKLFYSNELTMGNFKAQLRKAISDQKFVLVNFLRTPLHQNGGGHHSPIATYDEKTDRFLLLDVARYKYPSYWVKTEELWNAVNTKDEDTYRGFIVITP